MFMRRNSLILGSVLVGALLVLYYAYLDESLGGPVHQLPGLSTRPGELPPLQQCFGPRTIVGLDDWTESAKNLPYPYPEPLWGSYEQLRLPKTWTTADGRYGEYGWGEDAHGYNWSRVDWNSVDWAQLQNDCVYQNRRIFTQFSKISPKTRLRPRGVADKISSSIFGRPTRPTGQTAIVLRTWDSYNYTQEDLVHIRSVVWEAALQGMGRYVVFLLVDVKDQARREKLKMGQAEYEQVLSEVVPREFRNMAVLFDESLLESWYSKVQDHRAEFQMYQALQLFAHTYDKFENYWQLEMDAKFIVNVRLYLNSLSFFSTSEPRHQAFHRATYRYMAHYYHDYKSFLMAVDQGQASATVNPFDRPKIPEIPHPANAPQPESFPDDDDDFLWGVGEPADLILTNTLVPVLNITHWPYQDYAHGFSMDTNQLPRLQSPVSITRCSRFLLQLIHGAQVNQGLAVPSEATAPSFAWWHGLKVSYPPSPFFMRSKRDIQEMETLFNGGPVEIGGKGDALYNPRDHWDVANDGTWHWGGTWPREIMDVFLGLKQVEKDEDLPWILTRDDQGRILAPNLALHPVKTNGR